MDETMNIMRPTFSGTAGEEHEEVCQRIERLFLRVLRNVEQNSNRILDVHYGMWHDDMLAFRTEMKDLEIIIENLLATVFVGVNNVDEGIEYMQAFYSYMNRENLKGIFETKTAEIWQLFDNDIHRTKQEVLDESESYPSMTPYYAGRALCLRLKGARLQLTRELLEEAAWLPYCGLSLKVYNQHDLLMKTIEDFMNDIYSMWIHEVGDNPRAKLDRFLMRRSDTNIGLLECNIDPDILNLCHETTYWIHLKFAIPIQIQIVFDKWENLHYVFESVIAVIIGYNKAIRVIIVGCRSQKQLKNKAFGLEHHVRQWG